MNETTLKALAAEMGKQIKTPEDLGKLTQMLTKVTLEAALNAEMEEHLETERAASLANSRNGYNRKQITTEAGEIELATPRDRQSRFEPQLVRELDHRLKPGGFLLRLKAGLNQPFG